MERWAAHGPGPGTVCALLSRYGRFVIFGTTAWRRPGRFTRAPGGTVSSAGGRAPGCLCARLRLSRFDSRSQSLGPRRARRPETPRTPGFRPGQSRSTGPRRRISAWVPRRLSCDGDGQRVAHRCTWSGRTVRETVGVLKGLGNSAAAILSEGVGSALLLPLREKEPPEKGARERRMRVGTIAIPQRRRSRGQARGRGRPSRDWRPRSGRTSTGGATA